MTLHEEQRQSSEENPCLNTNNNGARDRQIPPLNWVNGNNDERRYPKDVIQSKKYRGNISNSNPMFSLKAYQMHCRGLRRFVVVKTREEADLIADVNNTFNSLRSSNGS